MASRNTIEILINAKDSASGVLGGVGGALQGLGKVALGATAAVAGAAVGIGAAITKLAVDAAPLQGISAAFEGLAESAGVGADDMLAALEEGSAGMIAQRDLMASFNKAAQLVSTDFAQTLPDAMGYLGKVSAATGEDMDYMLNSLVVGIGRLSPMILDNLGIQVSLTEAYENWAEANGVAVDEMTKSQQQAALTAQVMEKLQANTAAMPDVSESAAAGMARLQAQFQNVKDQVGLAFIPALTALLEPLGDIATDVGPKLVEWAKVAGEWLGTNLPNAIQAITSLFEGDFQQVIDSVRGIIARTFGGEGAAVFDQWVAKVTEVFENVKAWVVTNWPIIRDAVLGVVNEIKAWFEENWPVMQAIALTAFEVIRDIALTVAGVFMDTILPTFQEAFDNITTAMETLGISWADVWEGIKVGLAAAAVIIAGIIAGIVAVITGLANAVASIVEWITSQWAVMANELKALTEAIAQVFSGNWKAIEDVIVHAIALITNVIVTGLGVIVSAVSGFIEGVIEFFTSLYERLVGGSIVPEMMDAILDAFIGGFTSVLTAVSTGISNVKTFLSDQVAAFIEIGESLMGGLKEGIMRKVDAIIGAIRNAVAAIISAAQDKLQSGSPSRVFEELGASISEGLALGILGGAAMPVAATSSVIGDTISNVTNNNFNMTVNTRAAASTVIEDYQTMRAMVRA